MNIEVKTMDELLKKISNQNELNFETIFQILEIERKNVYKKRRFIFGDLKKLIEDNAEVEAMQE